MTPHPANSDPTGGHAAYTTPRRSVQTARYEATKRGTARTAAACARLKTAGAAPGSIIAAIIDPHSATKNANEPSWVAAPMFMPFICRTATTQAAAARPIVTVRAAAEIGRAHV